MMERYASATTAASPGIARTINAPATSAAATKTAVDMISAATMANAFKAVYMTIKNASKMSSVALASVIMANVQQAQDIMVHDARTTMSAMMA